MKKTSTVRRRQSRGDDMRTEYRFDYTQARPNRFAGRIDKQRLVVLIDADVSEVFSDSRVREYGAARSDYGDAESL